MPDDPERRSPPAPWERAEPLFGTPPSAGEQRRPATPPVSSIDEAFRGPLFGGPDRSPGSPEARNGGVQPASRATRADGRRGAEVDAPARVQRSEHLGGHPGDRDGHDRGERHDRDDGERSDADGNAASGDGHDGAGDQLGRPERRGDDGVWPRSEGKPPRSRGTAGSFFRELPVLLLIAFVLAFLLRTFVLQVFYIPSSSMEPTLQVNDRMAVEKVTYQFREPRRGEIVVFEGEELGAQDPDANLGARVVRGVGQFLGVVPASARDYVKRVIGLPGDEILIEEGLVLVNGEPIDEPYVAYPDGASHGPVTVPDGALFFLGDNRPNSSDSRRGLGFVPMDDVVGRSVVIIWPPANMGSLTGTEYDLPDEQ